ncbi:MAG TPA: protein kinase [Verrucomicrobiae bacterium]|jgi:serine/threonine protein phosphatase PrpC|nr:protein kinase [Verrucomicrobiae bacterium]
MDLTFGQLSVTGPVRQKNEDCIGFWQPEKPELARTIGIAAVIADGVGGTGRGEVASQLAVETTLKILKETVEETEPEELLRRIFNEANKIVYDASMHHHEEGRMATTLTVSIFRNDEVTIGHVGDSRLYLIRGGALRRLTTDHSYVALQVKLGLVKERDAMASPMRSMITRSIGQDLICGYDVSKHTLEKGDVLVQCTDGLYSVVVDDEIREIAVHAAPEEASRQLIAQAEKRHTEDNVSVQIIHIDAIEHRHFYRGAPYYVKPTTSSVSNEIQPGQVLDNRFEITELINRSGMASIFKANDLKTGLTVAIKAPLMQFESDPASYSRFQREEEIGQSLSHPYILKIFAVPPEEKSRPYIVMEYLQGQTLAALMREVHPLPEPDAAKIASRVCEALDCMHFHKIVHRDLKPQNIMICLNGSIRIMDFGIAKSLKARRLTFVGFSPSMGTPDYMAPEQVKGKRGDERTDIYALGAILYEMCTGQTPYEGESPYAVMNARLTGDPVAPRKINPKLTPAIEEIILHALERDPANRFQTAQQMKAELDDYEKVEMVERFRRLQSPQLWKSRFRMLPLILLLVLAQGIIFLLMFLWFKHKGK